MGLYELKEVFWEPIWKLTHVWTVTLILFFHFSSLPLPHIRCNFSVYASLVHLFSLSSCFYFLFLSFSFYHVSFLPSLFFFCLLSLDQSLLHPTNLSEASTITTKHLRDDKSNTKLIPLKTQRKSSVPKSVENNSVKHLVYDNPIIR